MLSALTAASGERLFDIARVDHEFVPAWFWEHRDCDGTAMYTTALLCRRYALPPMSARFVGEQLASSLALHTEQNESAALLKQRQVKDAPDPLLSRKSRTGRTPTTARRHLPRPRGSQSAVFPFSSPFRE